MLVVIKNVSSKKRRIHSYQGKQIRSGIVQQLIDRLNANRVTSANASNHQTGRLQLYLISYIEAAIFKQRI